MRSILAMCLSALLTGTSWAGDCDSCKVITVTGNAEYPPLSWRDKRDPTRITGFAIELLEIALKDLGIKVESRYVGPWARAQANVRGGLVDS